MIDNPYHPFFIALLPAGELSEVGYLLYNSLQNNIHVNNEIETHQEKKIEQAYHYPDCYSPNPEPSQLRGHLIDDLISHLPPH